MTTNLRAAEMCRFLSHCNDSALPKDVLDCGAGGQQPPLSLFHEFGYNTHGIDISESRISMADKYAREHNITLNIQKADMRAIPFEDESISFVYSWNSIFHMTKEEVAKSVMEMRRVLRPGGLLYMNLMSTECTWYTRSEKVREGEVMHMEKGEEVLHCFHGDEEADALFEGLELLLNEKRYTRSQPDDPEDAYVVMYYIARKPS